MRIQVIYFKFETRIYNKNEYEREKAFHCVSVYTWRTECACPFFNEILYNFFNSFFLSRSFVHSEREVVSHLIYNKKEEINHYGDVRGEKNTVSLPSTMIYSSFAHAHTTDLEYNIFFKAFFFLFFIDVTYQAGWENNFLFSSTKWIDHMDKFNKIGL